jgi:hypothetical protein
MRDDMYYSSNWATKQCWQKNQRKELSMFNIRKSKGTIVTKSVLPSAKTGRQLASSLLENVNLQEQLESLLKEQPSVGSPITPEMVKSPATVQARKVDSSQARIEGRASVLTELDRKAKESQVGYDRNSRFVVRNNLKPVLATGCPSEKMQNLISEQNTARMTAGIQPFFSYDEWTDAGDGDSLLPNSNAKFEKYVEPVLAAATVPVFIARHQYYLMFEADRCYFLAGEMKYPSILRRSASENISGQTQDNSSILMSVSNATKYRNMTRPEYNDVVASPPSLADLFRVFIQWDNTDKLLMDTSKAVTVWSKN